MHGLAGLAFEFPGNMLPGDEKLLFQTLQRQFLGEVRLNKQEYLIQHQVVAADRSGVEFGMDAGTQCQYHEHLQDAVLERRRAELAALLGEHQQFPGKILQQHIDLAVRPDSQIYMLLKNLARKLLVLPQESSQFGAAAFEHGILQMFVVLALRACIHAEFHTASVSRHHLMLDEVFLFIQAHLTEELTLERLEKEFFVSREHIAREFKRQTGQTVHRYIVKARLDRCCTLIEQGLPITEVYKTSGFGGYNHFFRAFKKEYGMTPKEYFSTTRQDARG